MDDVVEWRRHLHRHPELSFEERETAEFVAATLASFDGIDVTRPTEHAVVGRLRGRAPGPTIALRADIDALPISEESGVEFASERPGAMHACGHDGHTAMLLAAARELASSSPARGEVLFIFQPAEERAPGGARPLVDAGVLQGVDFVYGCHLWTPLEYGSVAVVPGPFMAAADFFSLAITGQGGHGGLPHLATDTVAIGAEVVANLQHVVARRIDPLAAAVVSVGSFHAGDAPNVIPGRAELSGTVRSFDAAVRTRLRELVEDVVRGVCEAHGAAYEFDYVLGYDPVVNDPQATELVRAVAGDDLLVPLDPIMGGDDFSAYLAEARGCYAFIGAGSEAAGAVHPHHHPQFRIDERALAVGVRLHVDVARRALEEVA